MSIKTIIKRTINRLGYDIHKSIQKDYPEHHTDQHSEQGETNINPIEIFIEKQVCKPVCNDMRALFQETYYTKAYPDIDYYGLVPFEHYMTIGWKEGKNPNPFLYSEWYCKTYPDAASSGLNPLEHYFTQGAAKGYNPGPRFHAGAYTALYLSGADKRLNPLLHYFQAGIQQGASYVLVSAGDTVCRHVAETPEDSFHRQVCAPFLAVKNGNYDAFVESMDRLRDALLPLLAGRGREGTYSRFINTLLHNIFNNTPMTEIVHCSRPLLNVGSDIDYLAFAQSICAILRYFFGNGAHPGFLLSVLEQADAGWLRHPQVCLAKALLLISDCRLQNASDMSKKLSRAPGYMHCEYEINLRNYDAQFAGLGDFSDNVNFTDLSTTFCTMPFVQMMFEQSETRRYNFLCSSCWLPFSTENDPSTASLTIDKAWNSETSQEIRRSIIDGDFSYCDRAWCTGILDACADKDKRQQDILPRSIAEGTFSRPLSMVEIILARRAVVPRSSLRGTRFAKVLDDRLVIAPPPSAMTSSLDASCNLKCPSCRNEFFHLDAAKAEEAKAYYDMAIHPRLLQGDKVDYSFDGSGEALASPLGTHIFQRLREVGDNVSISLRTNAFALTPECWNTRLAGIAKLIRHVRVSIDGATRETYEKLRFPSRWNVLYKNMTHLGHMVERGDLQALTVVFILRDDNWRELLDMVKLCREWHVESFTFLRYQNKVNADGEAYDNHDVLMPGHPEYVCFCA